MIYQILIIKSCFCEIGWMVFNMYREVNIKLTGLDIFNKHSILSQNIINIVNLNLRI